LRLLIRLRFTDIREADDTDGDVLRRARSVRVE
jgi:hypothetical protein